MKKVVLVSLVPILFHSMANAEENGWTDLPSKPAKRTEKSNVTKKSAVAEKVAQPSNREPSGSTNEMKTLPSPLNLPSAVATPEPTAPDTTIPGTLKFSGFTDFRYTSFDSPVNASAQALSGFSLEDGAFTAAYDVSNLSLTADFTFRRFRDLDAFDPRNTTTPTTAPQSSTSRFNFAADGSQLYLKYKISDSVSFNLGQFDTVYGAEAAEARSRAFSRPGIVAGILPVVITGALVETSSDGFAAKLFVSNPNNRGTNGTGAAGDDNSEYGSALSYSNEIVQTQIGYSLRSVATADGVGRSNRTLVDFVAGLTLGRFGLNFEATRIEDPFKNTISSADNTDLENAGYGYLGIATYKFDDLTMLGLRFEQLKDDPSAAGLYSVNSHGVALHRRLHQNVDLSAEWITYDNRDTAGKEWTERIFNIGAIVSF